VGEATHRDSAGKNCLHEAAIAIVAAPPATTDVTVPSSDAITPDSADQPEVERVAPDRVDLPPDGDRLRREAT
jgi:hypothetical protein